MKVFAVILLCAFAAVQGRVADVKSANSLAAVGENPWLVHLRIAVATSGLLETCVGSLIDERWVLTSASCLVDSRFVWIRYGVVDVISPSLVTETSAVRIHPEYDATTGKNNIALLSINRAVQNVDNVAPVSLSVSDEAPSSAKLCGFGENGGAPGETLSCADLPLAEEDGSIIASGSALTEFDNGAPVVKDGVQFGVVVGATDDGSSIILPVSSYIEWIEETADISLSA